MDEKLKHAAALAALLATQLPPFDPLEVVTTAMASGDVEALRLLAAGVSLQRAASKEVQSKGIRKAQEAAHKYTGRQPKAFALSVKKRAELLAVLQSMRNRAAREDEPATLNITQLAKNFKCGRTTLYRYIKASPDLLKALESLRKSQGQKARGEMRKANNSRRHATKLFSKSMNDSGQGRQDRPVLDAVRAERKAKRAGTQVQE